MKRHFLHLPNFAKIPKSFYFFSKDIKIAHSIFALPFAAVSLLLVGRIPSGRECLLLLGCMVSARSFAMGANRFLDREIDLLNPRTRTRLIPAGKMTALETLLWSTLAAIFFSTLAFALNKKAGYCSFPLLAILGFYPLLKRFSALCHLYLGVCLALSVIAVPVALEVSVSFGHYLISAALLFWTAGFDIIYALDDRAFDRKMKLYSLPVVFGAANALRLSRLFFLATTALLAAAGHAFQCGKLYYIGVTIDFLILSKIQLSLLKDLSEKTINRAFFTWNLWVGVVYLVFVSMDLLDQVYRFS